MDDVLATVGFGPSRSVLGRAQVADFFPAEKRGGVYVLHLAGGAYAVGATRDVVRRFHHHADLAVERISFKSVPTSALESQRDAVVELLRLKGAALREFGPVADEGAYADFDLVMPPAAQERWLADTSWVDDDGPRFDDPEQRGRYADRLPRLLAMSEGRDAVRVLRRYVRAGVPAARRGEASLWCSSCLPSFRNPEVKLLSRINLNWQEVFTAAIIEGFPYFSFHVARSPLDLDALARIPVELSEQRYKPGGDDQIGVHVVGAADALRLLSDAKFLDAIRVFNMRLMRRGPCHFGQYHCFALADHLLAPPPPAGPDDDALRRLVAGVRETFAWFQHGTIVEGMRETREAEILDDLRGGELVDDDESGAIACFTTLAAMAIDRAREAFPGRYAPGRRYWPSLFVGDGPAAPLAESELAWSLSTAAFGWRHPGAALDLDPFLRPLLALGGWSPAEVDAMARRVCEG